MPLVNGKEVGATGYGLMGLTWRPEPPSDEQAFAAMRAAVENGMTLWNGGEFYGPPSRNSMTLVAGYFAKYPEDADKVVLCIKGAVSHKGIDCSAEAVRSSLDNILKQLDGRKKLDLFECARRDPNVPLADTLGVMQEYVDKGLLGGISLSEVSAATIHEAAALAKIDAVEVELSLFSPDVLTNGIAAACAEHNIPLVAYSPLGHGILGGSFQTPSSIPSHLAPFPRFSQSNFPHNLSLYNLVHALAQRKGCTPAQLALAWTRCLARRPGMPAVIVPIPGSTTTARAAENAVEVELTGEEMDEIDGILAKFEAKGLRYPEHVPVNT